MSRTYLAADCDLYVSATGNDSTGDGSSGNPWATIAKAYAYAQQNLDLAGQWKVNCYLQSTYSTNDILVGPLVGAQGAKSFVIRGTAADQTRMFSGSVYAQEGAAVRLRYMQVQPMAGNTVTVTDGTVEFGDIYINTYGNGPMFNAAESRAKIKAVGPCIIVGVASCNIVFCAEDNAQIDIGQSFSCAGAPTWATAFVQADLGATIDGTGFSCSGGFPTGMRYIAALGGKVWTGGPGGATFFPGSIAGVSTGGIYQ